MIINWCNTVINWKYSHPATSKRSPSKKSGTISWKRARKSSPVGYYVSIQSSVKWIVLLPRSSVRLAQKSRWNHSWKCSLLKNSPMWFWCPRMGLLSMLTRSSCQVFTQFFTVLHQIIIDVLGFQSKNQPIRKKIQKIRVSDWLKFLQGILLENCKRIKIEWSLKI